MLAYIKINAYLCNRKLKDINVMEKTTKELVDMFVRYMLYVYDSYDKELDCMCRRLRVITSIPSLTTHGKQVYVLEWSPSEMTWEVSSQDADIYQVSNECLVEWFRELCNLQAVFYFDWEFC